MNDTFTIKVEQILKPYKKYICEETLNQIVDLNQTIVFQKGSMISTDHKIYLLLSGIIRAYYLDMDGNDVTHLFIFEGSIYTSEFLTIEKPHVCNFEALVDCTAIELNRTILLEKLKTDQGLMMAYINMLEDSLKRKILRGIGLSTNTATERYLDLKKEYPDIHKRVSQAHIASYLGITPVSLSRILRGIREGNAN